MFLGGDIMKKIISLFLIFVITLSLTSCGGDISNVKIDYGKSEFYTKEELDDAIEVVFEEFKTWKGLKMLTISYTTDEHNYDMLGYANSLAKSKNLVPNFTQVIEFKSDLYASRSAEGFSKGNHGNWGWILARSNGGKWHLMSWGYA